MEPAMSSEMGRQPPALHANALRGCPVFRMLPSDGLELLSEMVRVQRFSAGEIVCEQGEPASDVFVVEEGTLSVRKEGEPLPLSVMHESELFGEFGMFGRGVRLCTVVAETESRLLSLDYERFRKFLLRFPECALALLQVAIGRFVEIEPV